jgi:hypothetical protein
MLDVIIFFALIGVAGLIGLLLRWWQDLWKGWDFDDLP